MTFTRFVCAALLATILTSCSSAARPKLYPTYDPFVRPGEATATPHGPTSTPMNTATSTRPPTPTRVRLTVSPVATDSTPILLQSPTPDQSRVLPTPRGEAIEYVVQAGDSLGSIALQYDVSVKTIMTANKISDPNVLTVGTTLEIPAPRPVGTGPAFKIIPDSELVNGPASVYFDLHAFIEGHEGYLKSYQQDTNGTTLPAESIIQAVAQNYSVNPRLLLALLEYQSGWVSSATPFNTDYPMGLADAGHTGLYRQLTWAANTLNRGYYLWRANAISTVAFNDGTVAPLDPSINAGTAALQYFFAQLDDRATWDKDSAPTGFLLTYVVLFGNPFDYAIEPLVPTNLQQPPMDFPFESGQTWFFTGGPHGGWDDGSAWAALDFAPPGDNGGCLPSPFWATAMANGLITRAGGGAVIQDLDNDGYEQTGWTILYMHIAQDGRVAPGDYLFRGDQVGHPSCEGGIANATHVHIARKYNGEWIAADGSLPFNLDGWISSGAGAEYDGSLTQGDQTIAAVDGANDANAVTH